MLVRALRPHFNGFGSAYAKAIGDEYDHPKPAGLIQNGMLEAVDGSEAERLSGAGAEAGGSTKGNGAERPAKGSKGRAGANGGRRSGKGS